MKNCSSNLPPAVSICFMSSRLSIHSRLLWNPKKKCNFFKISMFSSKEASKVTKRNIFWFFSYQKSSKSQEKNVKIRLTFRFGSWTLFPIFRVYWVDCRLLMHYSQDKDKLQSKWWRKLKFSLFLGRKYEHLGLYENYYNCHNFILFNHHWHNKMNSF